MKAENRRDAVSGGLEASRSRHVLRRPASWRRAVSLPILGLALAVVGWAAATLLLEQLRFAVFAPQAGVEAASALARLFGALVLVLFLRDRLGERALWVAGGCERVREEACVDFTGTWDVVSSPDFDDAYLRLGGAPHVTLRQNGEFVKGEYEIGVMCGTINGGAHSDFIDFDFGGNDEMEEAFGEGQATLEGERLIFELWQYHGDVLTFECERRR